MAITKPAIVNTAHIDTVEVEVAPPIKQPRQWLAQLAGIVGTVGTIAAGTHGALSGFAWFAPAMAGVGFLSSALNYFANKGVVSKNIKTEEYYK